MGQVLRNIPWEHRGKEGGHHYADSEAVPGQRDQRVREIDQAIVSTQKLSVTLSMIMDNVAQQLGADAVTLLLDPHTLSLEYAGTWGFTTPLQGSAVRLGSWLRVDVAFALDINSLGLRDRVD